MTCGEKLVFLLPNRVCRGIKGEVKSVAIIKSDVLYILWKGNRTSTFFGKETEREGALGVL